MRGGGCALRYYPPPFSSYLRLSTLPYSIGSHKACCATEKAAKFVILAWPYFLHFDPATVGLVAALKLHLLQYLFTSWQLILLLAGLFWLQAGQTDTVYGAENANGLLFFLMMFTAIRVSMPPFHPSSFPLGITSPVGLQYMHLFMQAVQLCLSVAMRIREITP